MKQIACILFAICAYTNPLLSQKTEQLKWMVGVWKTKSSKNPVIEQWQITNDSTLTGRSWLLRNGTDTIPQETIELAYRNGNWFYIPTVKNQNNAQPVSFKLIYQKGTEFISENPAHDFPQRIAYRRMQNQLFASIEGKKNANYGKQNFDFVLQ